MTPHVSITLLRTQTDERLVELIAAGHDRAFDAVVDRYRRPLLRYAHRFLHEEARAEDVVQAAFVSAWAALRDGKPVRDLRPWLYRIVHNGALNVMKKPGREDVALIEASDLRPGPALEAEQREDVRLALDTIASLPERQRAALLAVAFDGRSHADVGAELGLKEPAVRQLVSRARRSLRVAATAITPWPAAVWLAGIGGAQAGDTASRVGELVGGVGAGTVFGGGALKAGALVAAAGAVAVSAPQMAEVVHRHHPRTVATAAAATPSAAERARAAATEQRASAHAPVSGAVLIRTVSGRLTGRPAAGRVVHQTSNGISHSATPEGFARSNGQSAPTVTEGSGRSVVPPAATTPVPAGTDRSEHGDRTSTTVMQNTRRSGRRHEQDGRRSRDHGRSTPSVDPAAAPGTETSAAPGSTGTDRSTQSDREERRRSEDSGSHSTGSDSGGDSSASSTSGSTSGSGDAPEQPEPSRSSGSTTEPESGSTPDTPAAPQP